MKPIDCFKAYDVRGKLGVELDEDVAYRIGRAFAEYLSAKRIVVGADIRLSSESLKQAVAKGIMDSGCDVLDLGMSGTEEVYFAAFNLDVDGGIEITASHNPIDYNGLKFIGKNATPISGNQGLPEIKKIAEANNFIKNTQRGKLAKISILNDYVEHLLSYIDLTKLQPLTIVVNSGNGASGHIIDEIEKIFISQNVPIKFIKIHHHPDGNFPNGIPNPLLVENRTATQQAIIKNKADCGIAWDGDFDRCFLFDEQGNFIEGYYIVGLLTEAFLQHNSNDKIIHDPRLIWNTIDIARKYNGTTIQSKSGHSFIKETMRKHQAVYGGEMSAHHYFRDFGFCDSGMIPWLLVIKLMSDSTNKLSKMISNRISKYPCSGEINYQVNNAPEIIKNLKVIFEQSAIKIDTTDGISFEFKDWRFNIRNSNTEPLLRLNVESKNNINLVNKMVAKIEKIIKAEL